MERTDETSAQTSPAGTPLGRRSFLKVGLAGTAGLFLPSWAASGPTPAHVLQGGIRPIRIRGHVTSGGSGLRGVSISDGLSVIRTENDGSFELVTSAERDFLRMSVPGGYRIPRTEMGTARTYRPIVSDGNGEMEAVFDLDPLDGTDDEHALLFLADVQAQTPEEVGFFHDQTVPDIRQTLQGLGIPEAFGMAGGDIMYDHLELFPGYIRGAAETGIPFFQVIGNHDHDQDRPTDVGAGTTFSRHFGPRYYSFDRGAVHYVVLDDVFWFGSGYMGYLNAEQLRWLENDLAYVEHGRPVVVGAHIPVLGGRHHRLEEEHPAAGISVANRRSLYELLEPYQAHILTGHTHENEHVFEAGTHEHVVAAVCGAWWSGPICGDGTPNGYAVYEVRGEEVTWRYKSTGHDFDHQIRVYPHGSDPGAPDEIVANVWDWDPEWTVVWYEDGDRRGEMGRRVGTDPLSEELHRGDNLPARRTWVDPYVVGHLFYAPASEGATDIVVEATDRFGRVYSARLEG